MNRVVFKKIDQIVDVHEWIVDGHDLGVLAGKSSSEGESSNSSESVDT